MISNEEKEEKINTLFNQINEINKDTNPISNFRKILNLYKQFIDDIYTIGKNDGIEIGKNLMFKDKIN